MDLMTGLIVVGIVYFKMSGKTASVTSADFSQQKSEDKPKASDDLSSIKVFHKTDLQVPVGDKVVTVAYRETKCDEAKSDVLFLHGMSFKSETWVSKPLWTLQLLYKTGGFRAVAIDLPGFGDSPQAEVDPAAFMEAVIAKLQLNAPVIVSPSMSGTYSLPYLFKNVSNALSRSKGFVPVAPAGTDNYKTQFPDLMIPNLVIYGENDKRSGASSAKNFETIKQKTVVELAGARHACYMNKPDEFHKHLIDFLKKI
ncbi:protein ABHD14A-like isoform X1 [Ruditapes philippinarum]|uniref:protein ABHD14A-like isoform X1 n=2 Tax=Ruditapes philippinarum TaxID=129788 RepID=UPI00295BA4BF|nr:protein ABHD14A-like isoform X1 [Ruditapes philippinarum]